MEFETEPSRISEATTARVQSRTYKDENSTVVGQRERERERESLREVRHTGEVGSELHYACGAKYTR